MIPAVLFYEDTLQPAAMDVSLMKWHGLPNPKIPIAFIGCETDDDWIEEGAVSSRVPVTPLATVSPSLSLA